mgnify:FL=1|jgi:hypothetical protein|tara:strand:- start:269 stop:433 length:165 start_codon:yes stop_codon:yes gene_type:complete
MARDKYNIYCKGKQIFSDLSQMEYFDIMEDLSIEYYQTGLPSPQDLRTEIYQDD